MDTQQPVKGLDEVFCQSCGGIIKKDAVICVKCGVPARGGRGMLGPAIPKDKTPAVLMAIFLPFGFWTWIYTYQKDAWKFWMNLGLWIVTFHFWGYVSWIWAIIDVAVKPMEWYENYPNG